MSAFFSRLFLFASVFASLASGQGRPTNAPICITHVTVIDTESGKESPDRTVVISGDRISEIKASKGVKTPSGSKVVDGTGKYLIPGLWDMHVHVWDYDSTFPLFLANGVTGVRDMFGPADANKFRAELAAKKLDAPHFYLASPIIDGHPKGWPTSIEVNTPEEARKVVDEQKQKGADFIKVYSRLSRESYFAIVEESGRQKIPFEGHVPTLISAWEASNAGQKSFEHLNGIPLACSSREEELQPKMAAAMTMKERFQEVVEGSRSHSEEKCQRLFAEFKKNGIWQVRTLTVNRSFAMLNNEQFRKDFLRSLTNPTPAGTSASNSTKLIETSANSLGASSAKPDLRADTMELTRLATEAGHAYARRDLPALERLTADDYTQTDVRGGVLNRSQWLDFVKNRKSELTIETDDVHVSYYGAAAVVTGHWAYTMKGAEKDAITYSRWTSVWNRYLDGWKRHAFQNTYVNANADRCALEAQH
jgi:ketosteroid isomerase-like protein